MDKTHVRRVDATSDAARHAVHKLGAGMRTNLGVRDVADAVVTVIQRVRVVGRKGATNSRWI